MHLAPLRSSAIAPTHLASLRASAIALLLAVTIAACGEETGPTPPVGPLPLPSGTFTMQTANSIALPTKIAERFISVTFEETFLDESALVIDAAGGQWSQTYRTRVFHNGLQDREEVHLDEGTIAPEGNSYIFTSTLQTREFTVDVGSATLLRTTEPMVFFPGAIDVNGEYQSTPP